MAIIFFRSQPASTDKINEAKEQVESMEANMGGTEILSPLRDILQSKETVKEYPRQVGEDGARRIPNFFGGLLYTQ